MSIRTIVEFNHDYTHKIEDDKVAFIGVLLRFLYSGSGFHKDDLKNYGVRVLADRHHSDGLRVIVNKNVLYEEPPQ